MCRDAYIIDMCICTVCLLVLIQPTHTNLTCCWGLIIRVGNTARLVYNSNFIFRLSLFFFLSPGLSLNSSILLQYSSAPPSTILALMSSGCGRCGVQSLSVTATSPARCSHSAPNASREYWMNPRTTSVLPDQQHCCYLAITPHAVSGLR